MASRILNPNESENLSAFAWQRVNVHLDDHGQCDCGSADPVGEAEAQAERIRELERLLDVRAKEAHAAGVKEGEQRGRAQAAAEMRATLERLAQTIAEAAGLRAQLRREAEGELVQLSLAIARRVLHREITVDPEAIHAIVSVALGKLQSQESCRVRVHPQHAAPVKTALERIAPAQQIEVAGDPSLVPGDVMLETSRGRLDASVDSQLAEIERGLADRIVQGA